ncbi:MAG: DUF2357 domain-containing protein [Clostridia bacterium]
MKNQIIQLTARMGQEININNITLYSDRNKNIYIQENIDLDMYYTAEILEENDEFFEEFKISINDVQVNFSKNDSQIIFLDNDLKRKDRIFIDCYAFVKISIKSNYNEQIFESKYIPVCIRPTSVQNNIEKMADYILTNYQDIFFTDTYSYMSGGYENGNDPDLQMKINIIKEIVDTYQNLYVYFRSSPKEKLISNKTVDSFEKLKNISNDTVQYITTHPDELVKTKYNTGIKIHSNFYYPNKTLVSKNIYSANIYENQIIVSFLKTLIDSALELTKEIRKQDIDISNIQVKKPYILSIKSMQQRVRSRNSQYIKEIELLTSKLKDLYFSYKGILAVEDILVKHKPKPTHIFVNIIQYRKIYDSILKWMDSGEYKVNSDKIMFSYFMAYQIYEYFVLIKMYRCLQLNGYNLINGEAKPFPYDKIPIVNKYKNTFIFEKNDLSITLYFQPVVSFGKENSINLYRNTKISFSGSTSDFYTPDYILKIEKNGIEKYIILDAKLSTVSDVKKYSVQELAFKYLVSISTMQEKDSVSGLVLFSGKKLDDSKDEIIDVYNIPKSASRPNNIFNIVSLSGIGDIDNCHENILNELINSYEEL